MRVKSLTPGKQVTLAVNDPLRGRIDQVQRCHDIEPFIGPGLQMPCKGNEIGQRIIQLQRDRLQALVALD